MKKNFFNNELLEEQKEDKVKPVYSASDKWLWLASGVACLIFFIIMAQLLITSSKKSGMPVNKGTNQLKPTTSEAIASLPLVSDVPADSVIKEDPNFQADQLVFSQIYQKPTTTWSLDTLANKAQAVNLPINIKKDAVNYYEIRRYYNLEPIINQLNKQGSVLVDNPFDGPQQDFFDFYRSAQANHWPLLLTSDVIFYYYQNNIKEVYKAVEAGFYDDLWQISNGLFKMANQRYQAALSQDIKGNDPILEAYRLNAQYWAVALKLLAPQANQIDKDGNINNFNPENLVLTNRYVGVKGSENVKSKLKDSDILEIVELYKNKVNYKVIAKKYGIHPINVHRIARNEIWKHVKREPILKFKHKKKSE